MPSCLRAASPTLARSVSFLTASSGRSKVILTGSAGLKGPVWSLIHFFSVEFSQPRIGTSMCVFNKRTIKVGVKCTWRCAETTAPSEKHQTASLFLCSSRSNAQGTSRALEGSKMDTRKLLGGTEENSVSPTRGR